MHSELNLAFTPLLPWPALALLAVAALAILVYALYAKQKGAGCGRLRWRYYSAPDRPRAGARATAGEKSVVAVVLDHSESQSFGKRLQQVDETARRWRRPSLSFPTSSRVSSRWEPAVTERCCFPR